MPVYCRPCCVILNKRIVTIKDQVVDVPENEGGEYADIEQFALALANGDLSGELKVKGTLSGSLKSLQSSLRHISWQAKQVAGGDFIPRVELMGEFSDSFNYMVESLETASRERDEKEAWMDAISKRLAIEVIQRKEAEQNLKDAGNAYRMIMSTTRHGVKNQLITMGVCLELMKGEVGDHGMDQYYDIMEQVTEKIGHLIEFTCQFESLGLNVPVWIDIGDVIDQVNNGFYVGSLTFHNDVSGIDVLMDPLIEKVFYSLVENSYMHGGHVSDIWYSCTRVGGTLELTYADNGVGVPESDKSGIFLKGFGKNTGLGLYFCKEILSVFGVSIKETGEPGKGAQFTITFPMGAYRTAVASLSPDLQADVMYVR